MKLGAIVPNKGPLAFRDGADAIARAADDLGLESLWAADHVVAPTQFDSAYPYRDDDGEELPYGAGVPHAEALMWLAHVAAITQRVRVGTGVLVVPQRHPALLAKQVATLDVLSGGRAFLGVGVGWMSEELSAFGVTMGERGARTDEYLDAVRELWRASRPSFAGRFVEFADVHVVPRPVQAGGPPIVVGGHSEASARRAGRIGDGWYPSGDDMGRISLEELDRLWAIVRSSAERSGRSPADIEVTTILPRADADVERLAEWGVARFVAPTMAAYDPALPCHIERAADAREWTEAFVDRVRSILG